MSSAPEVAGLREALVAGSKTTRLSLSSGLYAEAADLLDLATRNTSVLAHDAVGLMREPAPALLDEAVLDLARGNREVGNRLALKAAEEATTALGECNALPTSMRVGQIRLTAVDLLRASGIHLDEAAGELDGAVCDVSMRNEHRSLETPVPVLSWDNSTYGSLWARVARPSIRYLRGEEDL